MTTEAQTNPTTLMTPAGMLDSDPAILAAWAAAFATLLGVIAALVAVWWQMRKQWLLSSATMVVDLESQFASDQWRRYRVASIRTLARHLAGREVDLSRDIPVLGFFENVAHLARRGAIDHLMVWNKFGWFVVRYYFALRAGSDLIAEAREREADETLWEELEWLYHRMVRIYQRRGVQIDHPSLRDQRIQELVELETHLLPDHVDPADETPDRGEAHDDTPC